MIVVVAENEDLGRCSAMRLSKGPVALILVHSTKIRGRSRDADHQQVSRWQSHSICPWTSPRPRGGFRPLGPGGPARGREYTVQFLQSYTEAGLPITRLQILPPLPWCPHNVMPKVHRRHPVCLSSRSDWLPERCSCAIPTHPPGYMYIQHAAHMRCRRRMPCSATAGHAGDSMFDHRGSGLVCDNRKRGLWMTGDFSSTPDISANQPCKTTFAGCPREICPTCSDEVQIVRGASRVRICKALLHLLSCRWVTRGLISRIPR